MDDARSSLSGKVVVITGASSGFGRGAALEFAELGATVVVAARRVALIQKLADECKSRGARSAMAVATDVSQREEVAELARVTASDYGWIDVWVNNAGVGAIGRFERVPLQDHRKVIETNLLGTLYGSYFAYKRFLEQDSGGILINVASELGRYGMPYYASYAAAKHGIVALDDALRQEIAQNGLDRVHVCTVMPTAHDTPFFDHVANYTGHEIQAPDPLHDPQDVVDAIVKLARNPKDEKIVGPDGIVKVLMRSVAPDLAERIDARRLHKVQYEQAPAAPNSAGGVRTPIDSGTGVSAGRRKR